MKLGVVGLPNVGKSTLFNAITQANAQAANYPFCTIEPNLGVVSVPDGRLDELAKLYNPEKYTPATLEFVDIAGLVKGASKGEGLGNKFLSHIREVDAIVHVVRCFEDGNVVHVDGGVDPERDVETINLELIFADIESVDSRIAKLEKSSKGDKSKLCALELLQKFKPWLESGKPVRQMRLEQEEAELAKQFFLLTSKPVIYAANTGEGGGGAYVEAVMELARREEAEAIVICAKLEEEIAQLEKDEKAMFLAEMGLEQSGLERLVQAGYKLLGLISYLTAGPKEVRAWTIENGTKAPQAAGKIHSDFERGFIRAEIVAFDALMRAGNMTAAKEKGLVRSEGKEYVIKDGDVVLFRFNV